jgi:FKBP-type peptidyl-prolyl cis-trans isomerase SlpA
MASLPCSTVHTVQSDSFLTLHYRLSTPQGNDFVNTFVATPATLSLGQGRLSPSLEACLWGLTEGVHTRFQLEPDAAFGPRNPQLRQWVSRQLLDTHADPQESYAVGDVVQFPVLEGKPNYVGTIEQVDEDAILFDFNHPLAGQPVVFEVHILAIL